MESEVFPGDMLVDLLRAVGAVSPAFDPFDPEFAAEATAYEEVAARFVDELRHEGVLRHLRSSYQGDSFGLRRPGYPPERIDQLSKVMLPPSLPEDSWQARGPLWCTSECSVHFHTMDVQIDTPVVLTLDGVFFEDPQDHELLMFYPWTNLAARHLAKGPYSPRLVLMDAEHEPVYTIVPHGQSLAWQSFAMADAVLEMLFAALYRRGAPDEPHHADALLEWSTDAVTALLNADSAHPRNGADNGHGVIRGHAGGLPSDCRNVACRD